MKIHSTSSFQATSARHWPQLIPLCRAGTGGILLLALAALAEANPQAPLEEVVVTGRSTVLIGSARSASEGIVGQIDLAPRPILRPGDVLESIPGMIVTQHSGSGKSNQMYLRGFNLDHGTDFATWIDGMPVNMRTHGHGQGYTDINFLIPETIASLRFVKGPYHAELGDFSSAGGVQISTANNIRSNSLKLGIGENGFQRVLGMGGWEAGNKRITVALEAQTYDGPWTAVDEDVNKFNGFIKLGEKQQNHSWNLTAMHYRNEWNSADQIPERATAQGLIDELGSLDNSLGGDSHRSSISAQYSVNTAAGSTALSAYAIDYRMQLWSNFTYFLDDPVLGDQFEQFDDRRIHGGMVTHSGLFNEKPALSYRAGAQLRYDDIDAVALYRTRQQERLGTIREDQVEESSLGLFFEIEWQISETVKALAGARSDYYRFTVDARNESNSGEDSDTILSPKISLIYTLSESSEAYLSAGRGFHSNDARGTTISFDPNSGEPVDTVDPLVASKGLEAGIKWLVGKQWNSSLAIWHLDLDSELLFVGDAGTTEPSRPSSRWGLEFNNHWAASDIWTLEADLAWTHARFDDSAPEAKEIPGAIPFVASAALTADYPNGWFSSLRIRHFDGFPLIEDNSEKSDGATIVNLAIGWHSETWKLQLDILNLLDSDDHDIDYFYASRLPGEPDYGIEDRHYKVFEPRQLRAYVTFSF